MLTPDVMLFGSAYYYRFGYDNRPLYTLAHYGVVMGPLGDLMGKVGVIEASRENASAALRSGGVVLVFPGGDYDSYRPTTSDTVIDFAGRTGTSAPPSPRGCRSCRPSPSGARRASCS